jgi:hypothetical protein
MHRNLKENEGWYVYWELIYRHDVTRHDVSSLAFRQDDRHTFQLAVFKGESPSFVTSVTDFEFWNVVS